MQAGQGKATTMNCAVLLERLQQADFQRLVHTALHVGVYLTRPLPQTALVQRAHLFQQDYAVPREAPGARLDANVGGQVRLILLGR